MHTRRTRRSSVPKPRRRNGRKPFWATLVAAVERAADDTATLCGCADGHRCAA